MSESTNQTNRIRKLNALAEYSSTFSIVSLILVIFTVLYMSFFEKDRFKGEEGMELLSIGIVLIGAVLTLKFLTDSILKDIREKELLIESDVEVRQLQHSLEEDFFTNLIKINFTYIDKYYRQTQIQANKSFNLSASASVIAFLIIVAGICMMYFGKTESSIVATIAGVLSQFIAAVFFYLYSKTVSKMAEYHHKLVLTQNISLALKITEGMPEIDKVASQKLLLKELTKDINKYIAINPEKNSGK